ncbi:MAG: right-handed parallel beta-helix repeat-containing protein, partial [Pseudomonadota bacterium]
MKKMCQLATGFVIVAISFYSQILRADIMEHTENITQDTLWSASDIHLVQSMLEVEVGANLTIEPGAIVKFTDQAALVISGGLIAQGTAEQRILFTSHQDSVGQDNTDTSISPAPGDWLGVVFQPTADVSNSVLSHFQIRYAGASFTSALTVASGMSVTQGVIENNAGNGIQVLEASPEFSDMIIKNNGVDGINISNLYSSQVVFIQNCEITDNLERGISNTSYQSGIELMNSRIANNQGFGLLLEEELSFLQNNTLSHNALGNVLSLNVLAKAENTVWEGQDSHSIQISGGYTEQDLVLGSEAFPFTEVTINRLVEVNEGHILTLLEDTQITLYAPIWVKGRLESLGTPTAPVTWSLVSQSNIHFNTNISTLLQSATPEGKFVHSQFRHSGFIYEPGIETIRAENSHLTLQHAEISKSKGVSLFLQQSQATIEDSKILEAAGDGLVLQASEATVTRSIIRGQQMNGITLTDNSVLTLADSSLYANDNHGIELDASSVLEAARLEVYANANLGIATEQPVTIDESWWGHPDGPSIIANNRGQRVSALVTATNHRQEGPAFVYQNLGNAQIYSHQLTQPLVSGEAVTSDSNQAMDSFVENRQGSITLAFKQLTPDQDYQLLLNTFGDGFEGLQGINYSVTTLEGELLSLLSGYPIVIPKAQIQDGQITLVINPDGFRTTQVNRFFLAPINDAIPSQSRIVIESPDNGAAVNRESVIQGTYTGSVAEIYFRITQQDADKTTLYVGTANLLPNDRWQIPLNRMSSSIQEPIDIQIMLLDQNRQMVFADNLSVFFDTQLPPTVTELTASYSAPEIYLSWNNPKDDKDTVTRQLQRRRSEASLTDLYTWQTIASLPLDQTSFIDDDIIEGFVYSYRIVSIDAANNSQESFNTYDIYVSGSEDTQAPEIETLSVTTGYLDDANALAKANWTMNFGGETAQSFHLQISQDGGTTWGDRPPWNNSETIVLTGEKSSYIFSNLAINQDYQMRIQARDEWNNASAWLNQAFDTRLTPKDALRLDGDLNTTLTLPKAVYVIENRFNVRYDGELIIAPGSVIKIDKLTSLSFDNAKLTAVGTAEEPIIFTSLTDDIGGDSDGVEATPQAGDRGEFTLFKTIAELAHVELRYADRVQIEITGGQVVLRDAYLHDGKFYGLIAGAIDPRNPEIDYERSWLHLVDSRIERHQRDGLLIRDFSNNDVLALQNNHITDNGIGLSLKNIDSFASIAQYIEEDAQPKTVIENNAFENHREQGVFMENCRTVERFHNNRIVASGLPSTVPLTFLTQNTYSSHPNDYLGLCGTTHASHFSLAPLSTSDGAAITTFLVEENMTLRGDLTIAPGLVVKFQNALVDVAGSLQVLGTEQNPVILTASDNHRVGAATPSHENAACDGGVLVVRGGGRISHAQVSHHRSCEAFQEFFESGALVLENGQLDLNHVDFNNNLRALTAYGGGLKARYVTAWGNKAAWAWKHLPYDNFAPFQTIEARYNQFYLNHRGVAVIQDNNLARSLTTSSESTQLASTDTRVPLDFQHNWYFQNTLSAISNVYSQHGFEWNLQQSWWGNRDGASPSYQRGDFEITPQAFIDNTIWEAANLFLEYEPFLTTPPLNYSLGWVREQAWAVTGDYPITVQQGAIQTSDNDIEGIPKAYLQSTEAVELLISDLPDDNHLELYVVTYGYAQNSYEFAIELQNGLRIHDIENVMTHNNQTHTVKIPLQAEWLEAGELAIRIRNTQSMNPDSTINVAAVMVMESKTIEPPPTLEQLTWLDFDSNGVFNAGDKVIFTFATSTRATTDSIADWFLIDNQAAFASTDSFVWNAQGTELTVMVSADSQLAPGDEISLQFLEDSVGNPVTGTAVLPITTRQIPQFEAVLWSDVNQSLNFDVGDTVTVTFSKAMDSGSIRNNTQDANEQLVLSDGGQWGDSNIIAWNANQTAITITLTAGANVLPGSVISASAYLRDKLGVAVSGEIRLPDITDPPPEVLSIDFDDVNGDGRLSLGDQYRFIFSETINTDLLVPNTDTVNRFFNPDEKTYGRLNSVSCHLQGTQCWVTITEGFTITGNETVRFDSLLTDQNGSPILEHPLTQWQAHCDRLCNSLNKLDWIAPDWHRLRVGANKLMPQFPVLRMTIFPDGREWITGRHLPVDLQQRQRDGITAWVADPDLSRSLSTEKTGNYLAPWLARQQAQQQGAQEAILVDPAGNWLETSTGNLWGWREG